MIFQVTNSRTSILGADHFILDVLNKELRYPTALVDQDKILDEDQRTNWDGWVRLLNLPKTMDPWFPTGLVDHAKRICNKMNYAVSVDDQRVRPEGDIPEIVKISLRDYQANAVSEAVKIGWGVLDMPPRSGKTRVMCEIQRRLALPVIWIAPTDRIVQQTYQVLCGFFGNNFAYHLVGSANAEEASRHTVVVCTAATALNLKKEFYQSRQCIVVDEWHHAAAASYKTIFKNCDHVYHRYGMTGTFFRSGQDVLAMHALLAKTIYKVTSSDLLSLGYLVPVHVVFLPVPAKQLYNLSSNTFHRGHGTKGIHEHALRNQLIAQVSVMLYQTGRKTLVLVGTKKQGNILRKMLNAMLPKAPKRAQFQACEFVSTNMDRKKQGAVLQSFEKSEEVKVLLGTTILGEGVDLPTTDALVLARGEKAEVSLVQAMYRVSTAVPGKNHAVLIDFADRHHKKLKEHSLERLKTYFNEETFSVDVLDDSRKFSVWLNSRLPKIASNAL